MLVENDVMLMESPPSPLLVVADEMPSTPPTRPNLGQRKQPTVVIERRQVNVIIGSDPTATISSLSSALVTAQSMLAAQSQQLRDVQMASITAVAAASSAELAAQSSAAMLSGQLQVVMMGSMTAVAAAQSAEAVVQSQAALLAQQSQQIQLASMNAAAMANLSSSASLALASASAMMMMADQSSDAARAEVSMVMSGNGMQSSNDPNRSMAMLAIAIVASIVGTMLLTLSGVLCLLRNRDRRAEREYRRAEEKMEKAFGSAGTNSVDAEWIVASTREPRPEAEWSEKQQPVEVQSVEVQPVEARPETAKERLSREVDISSDKRASNWPLSRFGGAAPSDATSSTRSRLLLQRNTVSGAIQSRQGEEEEGKGGKEEEEAHPQKPGSSTLDRPQDSPGDDYIDGNEEMHIATVL